MQLTYVELFSPSLQRTCEEISQKNPATLFKYYM